MQTSVSHNSTESEVSSLDAGLRMDGILALHLWGVVIEVFRSSKNTHQAVRYHCQKKVDDQVPRSRARSAIQSTKPNTKPKRNAGLRMVALLAFDFWNVVVEVPRSPNSTKPPTNPAAGNCSRDPSRGSEIQLETKRKSRC